MTDYTNEINEVKKYYADLLILQYRNKPKARAMIEWGVETYLPECAMQIQDCLDIDNAVGVQLDLIGRILNCPRVVQGIYNDTKYFTFHVDENSLGFSTVGNPVGGTFRTIRNYNQSQYSLPDSDYRWLLKFKSCVNVMRGTMQGIDEALYNVFQGDVILKNNQDLSITYIVSAERTLATLAARNLKYYRAPEGVGSDYVLKVPNPSAIFGFNQRGIINKTVAGFSNKVKITRGTFLTKDNLISLVTG